MAELEKGAIANPDKNRIFDNTDPDGTDRALARIGSQLGQTLAVTVSKSSGTKETRNGMLEAKAAYHKAHLDFSKHSVAVTSANSELDKYAVANSWLAHPMWDWVGGRTSKQSAVGLLSAVLQGIDIDGMLAGARACDEVTLDPVLESNPAALLAIMWFFIGNDTGTTNHVVLPYKDRLELFSKYLQQLVMESLGKQHDLNGKVVNQELMVPGNRGSTDQHSYIQRLRDGLHNFFVTFIEVLIIEVLKDRDAPSMIVDPEITSGDYLDGFFQGTRAALYENGRESIDVIVTDVNPFAIGALVALLERTVGFYAALININAYHQPGVEAGKKAAGTVIDRRESRSRPDPFGGSNPFRNHLPIQEVRLLRPMVGRAVLCTPRATNILDACNPSQNGAHGVTRPTWRY